MSNLSLSDNLHYLYDNDIPGDGENNLVVLDYNTPTEINQDNFYSHFVYGIDSNHVDSVISSGRLIVKEGKLQTGDEEEILSFAREMGNKLWKKMSK